MPNVIQSLDSYARVELDVCVGCGVWVISVDCTSYQAFLTDIQHAVRRVGSQNSKFKFRVKFQISKFVVFMS